MRENTSPWFKVIALCTTLGLGGAYVWRQQQKAAPPVDKTVERAVMSGSKSRVIAPDPWQVDQEVGKPPVMLPGSKSFVFDQGDLPVGDKMTILPEIQPGKEVEVRVLMPSSKSGWLRTNPGPPPPPLPRTLLPGSKSPARILEPPKTDTVLPSPEIPVAPTQRTLLPGSKSIDSILRARDLIAPEKKPPAEKP
jgi:hypothetical protein